MNITKREIEEQLGYKIKDFKVSPVILDGETVGLSVYVVPKTKIEHITIDFKITPTGVEFEDV